MTTAARLCTVIGRRIAHRREDLDLTQEGLSRLLRATGVEWTPATLAKVESGTREIKVGELVALGLALDMTPADLLGTSERVTLGRTAAWVPGDAVTTWAHGDEPSVHQRAQWASDDAAGSAPLRLLDDTARRMAAYLSHTPRDARPTRISMAEVDDRMLRVSQTLQTWEDERQQAGLPVSGAARRAKERHVWAALRGRGDNGAHDSEDD